jgi:hypothetical protein
MPFPLGVKNIIDSSYKVNVVKHIHHLPLPPVRTARPLTKNIPDIAAKAYEKITDVVVMIERLLFIF